MRNDEGDEDGLGCVRGLMWAVPLGILLWAVLSFRAARQRDRAQNSVYAPATAAGTGIAVVVGTAAWAGFAFWAHVWLIGVAPMGR